MEKRKSLCRTRADREWCLDGCTCLFEMVCQMRPTQRTIADGDLEVRLEDLGACRAAVRGLGAADEGQPAWLGLASPLARSGVPSEEAVASEAQVDQNLGHVRAVDVVDRAQCVLILVRSRSGRVTLPRLAPPLVVLVVAALLALDPIEGWAKGGRLDILDGNVAGLLEDCLLKVRKLVKDAVVLIPLVPVELVMSQIEESQCSPCVDAREVCARELTWWWAVEDMAWAWAKTPGALPERSPGWGWGAKEEG